MGHSPSISDLQNRETQFRGYLDKIQSQLNTQLSTKEAALDAQRQKFYAEQGWKHRAIVTGRNADFMQEADWSLKNLSKVISGISKAIFGGSAPEGVKVKDVPSTVLKEANLEVYFAAKAFEVISGILNSIGATTSVTMQSSSRSVPLGAGLRLWVLVGSESYKSSDFFNDNQIYQYLYYYQVTFSDGESKGDAQLDAAEVRNKTADLYEKIIGAFETQLDGLADQMASGHISLSLFNAKTDALNADIDKYRTKLADLAK